MEIRVQSTSADGRNLLVECLSDGETQMVYPALADLGMAGTNWRAQETVESVLEQSEERSLSQMCIRDRADHGGRRRSLPFWCRGEGKGLLADIGLAQPLGDDLVHLAACLLYTSRCV